MSIGEAAGISLGHFRVETTTDGGHPPEFYAERLVDKLIHVSETAPPEIRMQALAYQEAMRSVCLAMIRRAIRSHETTLIVRMRKNGMEEAANLIWELGT